MKRIIATITIFSLFLAGCSSDDQVNPLPAKENLTSSKKVDFIEFEATLLDKNSFISMKTQHQNVALPDYTEQDAAIELTLSNHRENLESLDYLASNLDNSSAKSWNIIESNMGGHHVNGIFTFSKSEINEPPKELTLSDTPVGEVKLTFNPQQDE